MLECVAAGDVTEGRRTQRARGVDGVERRPHTEAEAEAETEWRPGALSVSTERSTSAIRHSAVPAPPPLIGPGVGRRAGPGRARRVGARAVASASSSSSASNTICNIDGCLATERR